MLELKPATFEDFEREAQQGNVVPIVRSVMADLHTPVSAFLRVAADKRYAFLLESVEGGERIARYSFLGVDPEIVVRGFSSHTIVEEAGKTKVHPVLATDWVRDYFGERVLARRAGVPPLAGGAVGYLTYDAAKWFEPSLQNGRAPIGNETIALDQQTGAFWMFCRNIIAFDRVRQRMEIISIVLTEEAEGSHTRLRELYDAAVRETTRIEALLNASLPSGANEASSNEQTHAPPNSNWKRNDFEAAVRQIQEHIAAGDLSAAVLSQRFSTSFSGDPLELYRALRATSPSPYMFFLRCGDESIMGASPEMLVRCNGQRLDYRPIAGTRQRGRTETEDWMLSEDLRTDEKEIAEHAMLVDLGRNDLGRVADYGSVRVDDLMSIERYSHVQHLVSNLRARLRDDLDRFDAFAACFPSGTVTGAPKIRAMQIIDELEPEPRGVYGGAVLYLDYAGNLDSCIAIRTIVLRKGQAVIQVGAGVVTDSIPEHEYAETVSKARVLLQAIELAERGL